MAHLDQLLKFHLIVDLLQLWSIQGRKLMKENVHVTLNKILIFVFGKATVSIMFTIKIALKIVFTTTLQSLQSNQYQKVTMQLFLHMDRQEQVKLIRWKALNTMELILLVVLYQEVWKRYFSLFRCNQTKISRLWLEQVISKFTMKSYLIYLRQKEQVYRLERIKRRAYLQKGYQNGQSVHLMKFIVFFNEVLFLVLQPPQK